jgi:hypothetical protein
VLTIDSVSADGRTLTFTGTARFSHYGWVALAFIFSSSLSSSSYLFILPLLL